MRGMLIVAVPKTRGVVVLQCIIGGGARVWKRREGSSGAD